MRRERDGPNQLPAPKRRPGILRFTDQLVHFFALMLWVGGRARLRRRPAAARRRHLRRGRPQRGLRLRPGAAAPSTPPSGSGRPAARARDGPCATVGRSRCRRRRPGGRRRASCSDGRPDPGRPEVLDVRRRAASTRRCSPARACRSTRAPGARSSPATFVVEGEADAVVTAIGEATRLAGIAQPDRRCTDRPADPAGRGAATAWCA